MDREPPCARMARRRRARGLLHRGGLALRVGIDRDAARAADCAAATWRKYRGRHLRPRRPTPALHQHAAAAPARAAPEGAPCRARLDDAVLWLFRGALVRQSAALT